MGLARVIQGLLTNVAQRLRRIGWAVGSGVGERQENSKPRAGVAIAQRRSMAGI